MKKKKKWWAISEPLAVSGPHKERQIKWAMAILYLDYTQFKFAWSIKPYEIPDRAMIYLLSTNSDYLSDCQEDIIIAIQRILDHIELENKIN